MAHQPSDIGPAPLLPFNPDGIPESLKAEPRWAPWVAVWSEKRGKYDKIPKRIDNIAVGISTAKPETWYTFKAVMRCINANPGVFAGAGYVVTGVEDLTATDIDNCIVKGVVAPWAQDIVTDLNSYAEISPSGNGIRLFNTGTLDTDFQNHDVGLEVYAGNDARFLTVSGQHIESSPAEVNAAPGGVFLAMQAQYAKVKTKATIIDLNMPDLIDELLLPTIDSMDLPYRVKDFLLSGDCTGDRSSMLHQSGIALYSAGLSDAEAFSTLCLSDAAMEVAMDHRRQDPERAAMYLWREQCLKAKPKAESRKGFSESDFDDITDKAPGQGAGPSGTGANGVPKTAKRFTFLQAAQYMAQVRKLTWFVRNVLPRAELGVIFGESGAGKSFLALDLVASVARGVIWRDRKVKQGNVAYICAEGASGFGLRLQAYGDHHGVDMSTIPLHVLGDAPNFLEVKDVKDVISSLKDLGTLDIIVVDTMAQVTPGANENSGEDMGRALSHCKAIHKATGAMVLLVAHAGKDTSRGIRGWSGIKGALDVELNVERSDQYRSATVSKMKDGQGEGDEYAFTLDTVVMCQDDDGDDITSCVLKHSANQAKGPKTKTKALGDNEKIVLRTAVGLTDLPGNVTTNTLITAAINELPAPGDDKRDQRKRDVMRAIESLVAAERISVAGGEVQVL